MGFNIAQKLKICGAVVSALTVVLSQSLADVAPETAEAAKLLVEQFCQAEAELNVVKRHELLKFSSAGKARERRLHGARLPGVMIYYEGDPLLVVASYEVLDVKVNKNRAVATVAYKTLARRGRGGVGTELITHDVERDLVQFQLVYEDGRWWIFDPPDPHVSLKTMIAEYERGLTDYNERFKKYPENFERDKQYYFKHQKELKMLQGLQGKEKQQNKNDKK